MLSRCQAASLYFDVVACNCMSNEADIEGCYADLVSNNCVRMLELCCLRVLECIVVDIEANTVFIMPRAVVLETWKHNPLLSASPPSLIVAGHLSCAMYGVLQREIWTSWFVSSAATELFESIDPVELEKFDLNPRSDEYATATASRGRGPLASLIEQRMHAHVLKDVRQLQGRELLCKSDNEDKVPVAGVEAHQTFRVFYRPHWGIQ